MLRTKNSSLNPVQQTNKRLHSLGVGEYAPNILLTIPEEDCPPLHLGPGPVTRIVVPGPVLGAVPFAPPGLFAVWLKRKGDSMKLTISTIL